MANKIPNQSGGLEVKNVHRSGVSKQVHVSGDIEHAVDQVSQNVMVAQYLTSGFKTQTDFEKFASDSVLKPQLKNKNNKNQQSSYNLYNKNNNKKNNSDNKSDKNSNKNQDNAAKKRRQQEYENILRVRRREENKKELEKEEQLEKEQKRRIEEANKLAQSVLMSEIASQAADQNIPSQLNNAVSKSRREIEEEQLEAIKQSTEQYSQTHNTFQESGINNEFSNVPEQVEQIHTAFSADDDNSEEQDEAYSVLYRQKFINRQRGEAIRREKRQASEAAIAAAMSKKDSGYDEDNIYEDRKRRRQQYLAEESNHSAYSDFVLYGSGSNEETEHDVSSNIIAQADVSDSIKVGVDAVTSSVSTDPNASDNVLLTQKLNTENAQVVNSYSSVNLINQHKKLLHQTNTASGDSDTVHDKYSKKTIAHLEERKIATRITKKNSKKSSATRIGLGNPQNLHVLTAQWNNRHALTFANNSTEEYIASELSVTAQKLEAIKLNNTLLGLSDSVIVGSQIELENKARALQGLAAASGIALEQQNNSLNTGSILSEIFREYSQKVLKKDDLIANGQSILAQSGAWVPNSPSILSKSITKLGEGQYELATVSGSIIVNVDNSIKISNNNVAQGNRLLVNNAGYNILRNYENAVFYKNVVDNSNLTAHISMLAVSRGITQQKYSVDMTERMLEEFSQKHIKAKVNAIKLGVENPSETFVLKLGSSSNNISQNNYELQNIFNDKYRIEYFNNVHSKRRSSANIEIFNESEYQEHRENVERHNREIQTSLEMAENSTENFVEKSDENEKFVRELLNTTDNVTTNSTNDTIVSKIDDTKLNTEISDSNLEKQTIQTNIEEGVKTAATPTKQQPEQLSDYYRRSWIEKATNTSVSHFASDVEAEGNSVVNHIIKTISKGRRQLMVPIVVVLVAVFGFGNVLGSTTMAIGVIFGQIFDMSDTQEEWNVRDYITTNPEGDISQLTSDFKNELSGLMETSLPNYHIVRFTSNMGSGKISRIKAAGMAYDMIDSVIPVEDELTNIIQPVFNAVVLKEYELEPTQEEANALFQEIFNKIFRVTTRATTEYCGQALEDGSGSALSPCIECHKIHAITAGENTCPNIITGTHTSYTCSTCDKYYYICKGHRGDAICGKKEHTHTDKCYKKVTDAMGNTTKVLTCGKTEHTHSKWTSASHPGCYDTVYCSNDNTVPVESMSSPCTNCTKKFYCAGYHYCGGHSVLTYTLNYDGLYELVNTYFLDPINELSNIYNRTDEEEKELQEYKDYYEIFNQMMEMVNEMYSDGLTMSDIRNAQKNFLTTSIKVDCQAVVERALSQLGQTGGTMYWKLCGFDKRVDWDACFVYWCMKQTNEASSKYPSMTDLNGKYYCGEVRDWFNRKGRLKNKTYAYIVPGDVVFFDWDNDGEVDRMGIIVGDDGSYLYTVEGNVSDSVVAHKYNLTSSVIESYGIMNY